jgi:NAD(P)H-dependent flavin oxidoreductase YrpB (nitropropane dioxygenase family)
MRSFQPVMLDLEGGLLPVGQVTGLIHDEPAVAELIERIVAEADAIQKKMAVALAQ